MLLSLGDRSAWAFSEMPGVIAAQVPHVSYNSATVAMFGRYEVVQITVIVERTHSHIKVLPAAFR